MTIQQYADFILHRWRRLLILFTCVLVGQYGVCQSECPPDMFDCGLQLSMKAPHSYSPYCISHEWVCDGEDDCADGSDEKQHCPPVLCKADQFQCRSTLTCIPRRWECDGESDCPDESDEDKTSNCALRVTESTDQAGAPPGFECPPDKYKCDGVHQCVDFTKLCNGFGDCPEAEDEGIQCSSQQCAKAKCPSNGYCAETRDGARCYCPQGYVFNSTGAGATGSCDDMNECEYESFCSQLCTNTRVDQSSKGYTCACVAGYDKRADDCIALGDAAYLLYASSSGIHTSTLNFTELRPTFDTELVVALDYSFADQIFCYVAKNGTVSFECAPLGTAASATQQQFMFVLSGVDDMAYDWLANNWYFIDNAHDRLFVCSRSGLYCLTLISTQLASPKSIAVDPTQGLMFFSHGQTHDTMKIERALMDGSGRLTLVQNKQMVRPQSLTLDYANRHVYWVDGNLDRLERINYDGTRRVLIFKKALLEGVVGISVFENSLFATTFSSLVRLPRTNVTVKSFIERQNKTKDLTTIRVVHSVRQPVPEGNVKQLCASARCDHLCVLKYSNTTRQYTPVCLCIAGYRLVGSTQCTKLQEGKFLVYISGKQGEVRGISFNASTGTADVMVPIQSSLRPVALATHAATRSIYFSDADRRKVVRRKLEFSDSQIEDVLVGGIQNVEGLAVDWLYNNIYYADEMLKTVSVASLHNTTLRRVLIRDNISHPRAIAIDPQRGYMYWTDWVQRPTGVSAKIERAAMSGGEVHRQVVVDGDVLPLVWPNGLSLDTTNQLLYFCDAYTDRIEVIDLKNPQYPRSIVVATAARGVKHPYGLVHMVVDQTLYLFWTEHFEGNVRSWNSRTNVSSVIHSDSAPLYDLKLFDSASETSASRANGSCTSEGKMCPCGGGVLCLASLSGGAACVCPLGMNFSADTCSCTGSLLIENMCGPAEFACANGRCINKRWECDGENDCGDSSDEYSACENPTCSPDKGMFLCSNNRCISRKWLCDGTNDCLTGEDEAADNCNNTNISCSANNMTRCHNTGRCIQMSWLCDGEDDCGDESDEFNCTVMAHSCLDDQILCLDGRCISVEYMCDGENDCLDGSDEVNCPRCNRTEFMCFTSGTCIPKSLTCNGKRDCDDGSDELFELCASATRCHDDEYQCLSGECLPSHLHCDGDEDCEDGSDEIACTTVKPCDDSEVACADGKCILKKWLCDGDFDCLDHSDESNCTKPQASTCKSPNWSCSNDSSQCIPPSQLCDGRRHCADGSDESCLSVDVCPNKDCQYMCQRAPLPEMFFCLCPENKILAADGRTCVFANVCDQWGICSQDCSEAGGVHKCSCRPGYTLNADNFTCDADDKADLLLLVSNRNEIRCLKINDVTMDSLVSGLRNTIALDFYYNHSRPADSSLIFWTDVFDDKIYRGTVLSNSVTNIEVLVSVGLATPEGIAVDWIAERIYWVESSLDQIEVARFDGTMRLTIISGNMESPRAIAVDPRERLIFWTDWSHGQPRVERASLSGEDRRVLCNISTLVGGGWPNGLTADYDMRRLFWIDAKSDSVHSMMYDGSDLREILRGHELLTHPFAISVFANYIYWTDWRTNSVVRANKWHGNDVKAVYRTVTQPFDVHVFHPKRQIQAPNPCARDNGGCDSSALCLLSLTGTKCHCPHLFRLVNNRTCVPEETFLVYARKQEISSVDLDVPTNNVMPAFTMPQVSSAIALDFDVDYIYWAENDTNSARYGINRAFLNGTAIDSIIDYGIFNVRGLAIDWLSRNLYFVSSTDRESSISVSKLSGAYRTVVLSASDTVPLKSPASLALHPILGKMFWSDWGNSSLWMAFMDGSQPRKLTLPPTFASEQILGLSLDYISNLLWWTTGSGTSLYSCDMNGDNMQSYTLHGVQQVYSLSAHNNLIYLHCQTTATGSGIVVLNAESTATLAEPLRMLRGSLTFNTISVLKVYQRNRPTGSNGCEVNNGGCQQLCLPKGNRQRVCQCTDGFSVVNEVNCKGIKSFLFFSNLTDIQGVTLDPQANNKKALAPISQISAATAVDFSAAEDKIYWVDSKLQTISRINRDLTNPETIISTNIMAVEGLAVDYVSGNIYWTDQVRDVIEVARLNGSSRYVVIHSGLDKPGPIVVDPRNGYMYWADTGARPAIERARMDGSERQLLVNDSIRQVTGLSLDFATNSLYWCDQKDGKIERLELDASLTRTVVRDANISQCSSLAVHGDYLYWIDVSSREGSIKQASKLDGSNVVTIKDKVGGNVRDLKVFDSDRQSGSNLCSENNGGCDDLCMYLGNNMTQCLCAHGRLKDADGTVCEAYDSWLAFSKVSGIETIHLLSEVNPNPPFRPIENATAMRNVIGLAIDRANLRYYFTDIQIGNIQSVGFDGTDFKVIVENIGSAEGLVFDPVFRDLYWTSYTNSSVSKISVDVRGARPVKIVQLEPEDHPRAIVIENCNSRMYWTNWHDKQASIQSAYLWGDNIQTIISTNIQTPNGLAIDRAERKLYWSDARLDKIERCNWDGSDRKVVVQSVLQHAFGLAVHDNYIYWTDWVLRAVLRANKYTGGDVFYLRRNLQRQPMGLVIETTEMNTCTRPCEINNGGCEQVCTEVHPYGNMQCSCNSTSLVLQADNKTCGPRNISCAPNEFLCSDGQCISIELTCDLIKHCPDGSDENIDYCTMRQCPSDYFRCRNRICIPASKHCNKIVDCQDGSDEKGCQCGDGEFLCATNNTCILARYRCDYDKDCPDASDEMNCPNSECSYFEHNGGPSAELIKCNHTTSCILSSWVCDGHNDCWDNSDEIGCTEVPKTSACPDDFHSWFHCVSNKLCVPASWQCDGDVDCDDGSDERNCTFHCPPESWQCTTGNCIPIGWRCDGHADCVDRSDEDEKQCTGHEAKCPAEYFKCDNTTSHCIPTSWLCDGDNDCSNGFDELHANCKRKACDDNEYQCDNYRCILNSMFCDGFDDCGDGTDEPPYCGCQPHQFQCSKVRKCIGKELTCDGKYDCADKTDEDNCPTAPPSPCGSGRFLCKSGVCIDYSLTCNERDDCGDASDEISCDLKECLQQPSPCDQLCKELKIGYQCSCISGYELSNDSRTCRDINECERGRPCGQYCFNMPGSYRCACADGYILASNQRSCKANHTMQPSLLVTNRYYIRNISTDGLRIDNLATNLSNAVALDYDWFEQKIYWTDVTSMGSVIGRMDFSGSNREILHSTTVRNPDGIAVDWRGRNLYWCDKTTDTIEVSRLNGQLRKVLVRTGLDEPRAITVHPYKGLLFYTDWGDEAHIGRLGMEGSNRIRLKIDRIGWPNALCVDYITDHIYWGDARLNYIATADLDGANMHIVLRQDLPHIFALSMFEDYLYFTDWERKSVERVLLSQSLAPSLSKNETTYRKELVKVTNRPMDIQVLHPLRQKMSLKKDQVNPCENNGGCGSGSLCLIKYGGNDRMCACPEKHYLSQDKLTCYPNCSSSEFLCNSTYKCIPFWWKCDGQDDCGDRSDEPSTCSPYHCLQPGLFQCANAKSAQDCIPPTQICDCVTQCSDGSDELNCKAHTCLDSQFKCQSSSCCIPKSQRCDGYRHCNDTTDEKDCPSPSCSSTQFACDNKRCIPYVWRCDNDNDCGDGSDEHNCNVTCRNGYFACSSGRCIPETWRCDGDKDCGQSDDTDEQNCAEDCAEESYFKCANKRCIPGRWRCDFDDDCRDGSDEVNCTAPVCSENERRCDSGQCYPEDHWCNGIPICTDGSDEKNCTCNAPDQHRCSSGFCLDDKWRCDGEIDCNDGSDEENCLVSRNATCDQREFRCANSLCIPLNWVCDGQPDCADKSDENATVCENVHCAPQSFRCTKPAKCIPAIHRCDHENHCADGSDEKDCEYKTKKKCSDNEYKCLTGDADHCIPLSYLCDGYPDCADQSDEKVICDVFISNCHIDADCFSISQQSSMKCIARQNATNMCMCGEGYQYHQRLRKCVDIDDCQLYGKCDQRCTNMKGGYKCSCDTHYQLSGKQNSSDTHAECKVVDSGFPYLLIAMESELHGINLSHGRQHWIENEPAGLHFDAMDIIGQSSKLVSVDTAKPKISVYEIDASLSIGTPQQVFDAMMERPRAVAVDWVANRIYWSDVSSIHAVSIDDPRNIVTVVTGNLKHLTRLVVDPENHRLYWLVEGSVPRIETALLDGSERRVLVNDSILWPTDIAVDFANDRIYWTDTKLKTIESVNVHGRDRQVVIRFSLYDDAPFRLVVFENYIYVSLHLTHAVMRLPKFCSVQPTCNKTLLFQGWHHITDIAVMHVAIQKNVSSMAASANPCLTKPCNTSMMCFNLPAASYNCVCPFGKERSDLGVCRDAASHCQPNDCNGLAGTCSLNEAGGKKCSCTTGYSGDRCENDVCFAYCLNGGTCRRDNSSCLCNYKFSGPRCEFFKCTNYCQNKGQCNIKPSTGEPQCICQSGYTGSRCEKKTDPCSGQCYNGGQCSPDKDGRPVCKCPLQYTGSRCDSCLYGCQGDQCHTYTCLPVNMGFCQLSNNSQPLCQCLASMVPVVSDSCSGGSAASMNCSATCTDVCENFCRHGEQCTVYNNRPRCTCDACSFGDKCEQSYCSNCADGICVVVKDKSPKPVKSFCSCESKSVSFYEQEKCRSVPASLFKESDLKVCMNGGVCTRGDTLKCSCPSGYSGSQCEVASCSCQNGGTCDVTDDGDVLCRCAPGYEGKECERYAYSVNVVVASVVPTVIVIIIIVIVIVAMVYRRHIRSPYGHGILKNEPENVTAQNPMFGMDDSEDPTDIAMDNPFATSFTNELYNTLYTEAPNGKSSLGSGEKRQLLPDDDDDM